MIGKTRGKEVGGKGRKRETKRLGERHKKVGRERQRGGEESEVERVAND